MLESNMTKLLEEALKRASELPPEDQDALAAIVLDELASEKRWSQQFSRTQRELSALADEAIKEHRTGKTKPFDPDGP